MRCLHINILSIIFTLVTAVAVSHSHVAHAHDIASVQNINNDTVNAQSLPPIDSQPMPSSCIATSDCYSLAPESSCAATTNDISNSSSSFVTPCSLCSSLYRFGAAPRICSPSTATCTCAGGSPDAVSEFSVGLRPHLATLTATSVMEHGSSAIECQWHFQTLQGDEENPCQQQQQELLLRGVKSSTRLVLQVAIDSAALVSLFRSRHPRALMLMEPGVDDIAAAEGDGLSLPCELCLIFFNSAASSCFPLMLPVFGHAHELITASAPFEFSQHWKQLHGQSAQFELISAGAHTVSLGTSHVVTLNVPDAINRSKYIDAFAQAASLHHRAVLKNSLIDRLPLPVGDSRFLSPLPPLRTFGDFNVEGLVLPTHRAVAVCIVGETRNFFEDGALTAQLVRENIGSSVSQLMLVLWILLLFSFMSFCRFLLSITF
jgi:hypothetical protein